MYHVSDDHRGVYALHVYQISCQDNANVNQYAEITRGLLIFLCLLHILISFNNII